MDNYGLLTEEFGEIGSGYKALYLWDHGWAKKSDTIYMTFEKAYEFRFPPIPAGEIAVVYVSLEKDNPRSLARMLGVDSKNGVAVISATDGMDDPYVYIYTTAKNPAMNQNLAYGLQVFDENGGVAYDSNYKTLKSLFVAPYNRGSTISGYEIQSPYIAVSTPSIYGYIHELNSSAYYVSIGGVFVKRVGNKITTVDKVVGGGRFNHHPSEIFNHMNVYYGIPNAPVGYSYLLNVADVSDISKKPK